MTGETGRLPADVSTIFFFSLTSRRVPGASNPSDLLTLAANVFTFSADTGSRGRSLPVWFARHWQNSPGARPGRRTLGLTAANRLIAKWTAGRDRVTAWSARDCDSDFCRVVNDVGNLGTLGGAKELYAVRCNFWARTRVGSSELGVPMQGQLQLVSSLHGTTTSPPLACRCLPLSHLPPPKSQPRNPAHTALRRSHELSTDAISSPAGSPSPACQSLHQFPYWRTTGQPTRRKHPNALHHRGLGSSPMTLNILRSRKLIDQSNGWKTCWCCRRPRD